jgi:hypothetical protein
MRIIKAMTNLQNQFLPEVETVQFGSIVQTENAYWIVCNSNLVGLNSVLLVRLTDGWAFSAHRKTKVRVIKSNVTFHMSNEIEDNIFKDKTKSIEE